MPDPQLIVSGFSSGVVYGLIALGFALAFRSTRIVNFAQGDLVMLGGFIGFSLYVSVGLPFLLVLPLTAITVGLFMVVVERVALRPVYKHGPFYAVISTIGLSAVLLNAAQLIWTRGGESFPSVFGDDAVDVLGVRVVKEVAAVAIIGLLVMAVLYLFVAKTRVGLAVRAAAGDAETARLVGINPAMMVMVSFFLAGVLGATAGVLLAPITFLTPGMGVPLGIKGFIAAAIGGLGSIPGAMLGGVLLGLIEVLAAVYVDPAYRDAVSFLLLAALLLIRPWGIFGEEGAGAQSV